MFYDKLFSSLDFTLPRAATGRRGFPKEAMVCAFIVTKCEGFSQITDLMDYLDNNRLIAHYCGFNIKEPLPSYWAYDRCLRQLDNPRLKSVMVDLVRHLYQIDTPTNILPSIHVYNSVVCYLAIDRCKALKKYKAVRQGALVLTVLIVLSTMFLKQHSVFDVTCALVLNAVVYFALYQPKEQIQAEQRVDGRKVRKKVFGH